MLWRPRACTLPDDLEAACRKIVARYVTEGNPKRLSGLSWEMALDATLAMGWKTPGELRKLKGFDPYTEPRRRET